MPISECICEGNWRKIIEENTPLFGRKYKGRNGDIYTFCGVMWGDDDFYYSMWREGDMQLLSCVGYIESFGFELVEDEELCE